MATSANTEKAAFIRELKKRQNELAEASKKQASTSFTTDEELINMLDLSATRQQFKTKISRVRYGLDKNKDSYVSINYVISDGDHEGTTVSKFYSLGGDDKAKRLKRAEQLFAAFQRLNVDTTKWAPTKVIDKISETSELLTETKPTVTLAMYTWGDDPKDPRLGVDIVSCIASKGPKKGKPSDEEDEEDEEGEEEDQYEDADAEEAAEEAEEEDAGHEDYSEWVGYEASFDTGDGTIAVATTEYDQATGLFTVEDDAGDLYEASFDDLTF